VGFSTAGQFSPAEFCLLYQRDKCLGQDAKTDRVGYSFNYLPNL
jgi:hypothetical protein